MQKNDDLVGVTQAAALLGITRSTLYTLIRKSRELGEETPFVERTVSGRKRLVADRASLIEWNRQMRQRSHSPVGKKDLMESVAVEPQVETPAPASDASLRATSTLLTEQASASPLAQSAETSTVKELVKLEPTVTRGVAVLDELPSSYLETRLTVLPRDPDTIVVYWDVNPDTANAYPNARWGLSITRPAGNRVIEIQYGARNWYIHEPGIAANHEVFFGPLDSENRVIPLARSEWKPYAPAPMVDAYPTEWGQSVVSSQGTTLKPATATPVANAEALAAASGGRRSASDGSSAVAPSSPHSATWNNA